MPWLVDSQPGDPPAALAALCALHKLNPAEVEYHRVALADTTTTTTAATTVVADLAAGRNTNYIRGRVNQLGVDTNWAAWYATGITRHRDTIPADPGTCLNPVAITCTDGITLIIPPDDWPTWGA